MTYESTPTGRKSIHANFTMYYGDFSAKEMDAFGNAVMLLAGVFNVGVDRIGFQTFARDSDHKFQIREWKPSHRNEPGKVRVSVKGSDSILAGKKEE